MGGRNEDLEAAASSLWWWATVAAAGSRGLARADLRAAAQGGQVPGPPLQARDEQLGNRLAHRALALRPQV